MPTVFRQEGFDFMIYTDDHPPAHVHVFKAEGEVIINLGDNETRVSVRENNRMSNRNERRAVVIAGYKQVYLLARWRGIHG
jgi:Domain of unknown function (DUF4160)